jgi:hypothetical protein
MSRADRFNKPWHGCHSRDERICEEIAALERKLAWIDDLICRTQFARRLLAEDPDGWRLVLEAAA